VNSIVNDDFVIFVKVCKTIRWIDNIGFLVFVKEKATLDIITFRRGCIIIEQLY